MEKDNVPMFDSEREKFAAAIKANYDGYARSRGKPPDCVIVSNEDFLSRIDAALAVHGITVNAIIDGRLPRRTLIWCIQSEFQLFGKEL